MFGDQPEESGNKHGSTVFIRNYNQFIKLSVTASVRTVSGNPDSLDITYHHAEIAGFKSFRSLSIMDIVMPDIVNGCYESQSSRPTHIRIIRVTGNHPRAGPLTVQTYSPSNATYKLQAALTNDFSSSLIGGNNTNRWCAGASEGSC